MSFENPEISAQALAERLGDPNLVIFDGSFRLDGVDPRGVFAEERLPGALFFDIEAIADHDTALPHMLPTAAAFAKAVGDLGLSNQHEVVVYDQIGIFSAARVWWMLRVFGFDRVRVLSGGLPRWKRLRLPLETGPARLPAPASFAAAFRPELVLSLAQMKERVASPEKQILDARAESRFRGAAPESRPGLRAGAMPGARNVPHSRLTVDGGLRPEDELIALLDEASVDLSRPIAATCGSGVSACVIALAAFRLGKTDVAVYDGSWSEWGGLPDTPVVTDTLSQD